MKSHVRVVHRCWPLLVLVPGVAFAQPGTAPPPAKTDAPVPDEAKPAEPPVPDVSPPVTEPVITPDAPVTKAPSEFTFEPFGFLRLQYIVVQNDPFVAFVGRDDGFELQNARFGVRGVLGKKVSYRFSIDGAVDERAQINVPDGKLRVGMRDAFADVAIVQPVVVRAGYFETLVDPDLDDDQQREFVDRPLESRGVRATQGFQAAGLTPGRSLGAAVRSVPGEPASGVKIGFEVAVQNGADEFASDNDNDTPALSGSVIARLPNRTWLVASGRYNRRTEGALPLQRDEDDFEGTAGARVGIGPIALGAGGVVQRTQYPTTGGPVRNAFGAHAQLLVIVPGSLPIGLGYRFSILDPSSLIVSDRVMEHSVGAVLAVPSMHLRVQLQLTHATEQGARELSNDRAQLAAELTL